MTPVGPLLSARDAQIFTLLRRNVPMDRILEIGFYHRSWNADDVQRVQALIAAQDRETEHAPEPPPRRASAYVRPPDGQVTVRPWTPPEASEPRAVQITEREAQVLTQLCHGLSYGEAALHLGVSENTVKSHARKMLAALGARSATHAFGLILSGAVVVTVTNGYRKAPE